MGLDHADGASQEPEIRRLEFTDPDGQILPLLAVGDAVMFPIKGLQENFRQIKDFQFKDDDVIVTTYPRSGTHFIWEVVHMLKRGSAEYIDSEKEAEYLEMFFWNDVANKSDRVINSHLVPELLPVTYKNRKCKFIHLYRNPKDTMVSLYNHAINSKSYLGYDGKFSGFFELAMKGQVQAGNWMTFELKYEEFFKNNPDICGLMMSYEELKLDPITSIKKISEFLELDRDDSLISSIADAVSFSKMKAGKFELKSDILKNRVSNEHYSKLYRKGVVGDWKNWFTVAQSERFNEEYERRMKGSTLFNEDVLLA